MSEPKKTFTFHLLTLFVGGDKAIYVVGGLGTSSAYSADILHADGTSWCSKKIFSEYLYCPTMSGMTVCGGCKTNIRKKCSTYIEHSNITWSPPVILRRDRTFHASWTSNDGIVLMGGKYSLGTTEIVKNGVSQEYFDLKYEIYG